MSELPMIGTVGISQETAAVIAPLEAAHSTTAAHAAIDRLIVLDHAAHPRERALHQDAKRGNFRQEDDGA